MSKIYDEALKEWEHILGYGVMGYNNYRIPNYYIEDALQHAKKQGEAPTSIKVCQDIEYWLYKCIGKSNPFIKYVDETKSFVYECDGEFKDLIVFKNGYVEFKQPLPPYLIVITGKFYEKELVDEKSR